jgi:hypothetical protein
MKFVNSACSTALGYIGGVARSVSTSVRSIKTQVVAGGTAVATAAGSAHADVAADISAAFAGANTNVTLAVGGVIALVAIVTGVGLIVSLLRK